MSNSKLVSYTKLSPNYNPRGNNKILKIMQLLAVAVLVTMVLMLMVK